MNYELVTLDERVVKGTSIVTSNQNGKTAIDIGDTWNAFINEGIYNGIEEKKNTHVMGLYYDYESDMTGTYSFMACCEIMNGKDIQGNSILIPKSTYARFSFKGNMRTDVIKVWQKIWETPLKRKYTYDFEVYHNDSEDINNQTIDIYIAVK